MSGYWIQCLLLFLANLQHSHQISMAPFFLSAARYQDIDLQTFICGSRAIKAKALETSVTLQSLCSGQTRRSATCGFTSSSFSQPDHPVLPPANSFPAVCFERHVPRPSRKAAPLLPRCPTNLIHITDSLLL